LLQVDGDTSTNDTVIALASGLSGLSSISSLDSDEAIQLQACLDAVSLILYNSITILSSHIHSFPLNEIISDIRQLLLEA
jgi:glutamate N-acetyltransferase/amino-acid N-acetyltransferase